MQSTRVAEGFSASTAIPCIHREIRRSQVRHRGVPKSCPATATQEARTQHATARPTQQILQPRSPRPQPQLRNETDLLPVYVALESDVVSPLGTLPYAEALKVGLKALRLLGVRGISVDVLWGVVEKSEPQVYNWSAYKVLFSLISEMGFKIKVNLCFNSTELVALPDWVHVIGEQHPDIWFMDKGGERSAESLSVGVDEVPCLGGRTGVEVHADLMRSFRNEFEALLGGPITEILIGLGPHAELRYPSQPPDKWEYPGVGEFQCYDRYMLGSLKACAEQVQQPPWGLGGPHDAGTYKTWPHQSGFFTQTGNWSAPYGRFFLQWYSEMLVRHAQRVMSAAHLVFSGHGVTLNARAPACHWWYNSVSHAAELTAGYYHTSTREGYLQAFQVMARHRAGVHLGMAEARGSEKPATHCSEPEKLLLHQRTVAAALHLPVTLENTEMRFDEAALTRMHASLFEPATHLGVEIPPARSLVFNRMSDVMFETSNWQRFKTFVRKVRTHAEDNAALYATTD